MKFNKLFFATMALALFSCTGQQTEQQTQDEEQAPQHLCVTPTPATFNVESLPDGEVPVAFAASDFDWDGGKLTFTVYNADTYDGALVDKLQEGDTIVYDGNSVVVKTITKDNGFLEVNEGLGNENGASFRVNDNGTYTAAGFDDHFVYSELGKVQLPLAKGYVIEDCGPEPNDPVVTISENQKDYIGNLFEDKRNFNELDTRITVKNGEIVKIARHWIP